MPRLLWSPTIVVMSMTTPSQQQRIDLLDRWYYAAAEARLTFADWRRARKLDKRAAYRLYVIALDREENAATALERSLARAVTPT